MKDRRPEQHRTDPAELLGLHADDPHPDDPHPDDAHTDGRGHRSTSSDEGDVDLQSLREALRRSASGDSTTDRTPPARRTDRRRTAELQRRRTRRRRRAVLSAVVVLVLIAGATVALVLHWRQADVVPVRDYVGTGDTEVVVRVEQGDALADIAAALVAAQVVASTDAFVAVGSGDGDIAALQPGYFRLRMHSSASSAADQLADPTSRVGRVRIIPGGRLSDVTSTGGKVVPGYLSQIAQAACVPLNGRTDCASAEQLAQVAAGTSAQDLGVVDWALDPISRQPQGVDRLEGVLLPGDYDVPPGADARTLLSSVFSAAAVRWNASDVISDAEAEHLSPYEAVIIASVVERESNTADMPQVARVVFNRIKTKMKWQMDSTVNYALDRAQLSVTYADLEVNSPYNTYRVVGMPPTPISSPGDDALEATYEPSPGDWLYFVKVDQQGNSCFSVTAAQHEVCIAKARAAGVLPG